jgi:hypothetical protein
MKQARHSQITSLLPTDHTRVQSCILIHCCYQPKSIHTVLKKPKNIKLTVHCCSKSERWNWKLIANLTVSALTLRLASFKGVVEKRSLYVHEQRTEKMKQARRSQITSLSSHQIRSPVYFDALSQNPSSLAWPLSLSLSRKTKRGENEVICLCRKRKKAREWINFLNEVEWEC